ncbi:hypothetical protein UNSW3_1033 [Campylobacter concisus UNSW3]|uniref:Uncharacterized protein n=1 Tax=Campylobacter concisus UNSW3 TaxID=1242966 RepID=U2GCD5_9BACT|nr:hypothetical protein [Campylobacter concisus]ERJ23658.1 hypothetical protein UNSW3_1033 [Campylobacter concisus UNSW3]
MLFSRAKIVFVKRKLLYKFLVVASDHINLLTKHKFTNLKRQNKKIAFINLHQPKPKFN